MIQIIYIISRNLRILIEIILYAYFHINNSPEKTKYFQLIGNYEEPLKNRQQMDWGKNLHAKMHKNAKHGNILDVNSRVPGSRLHSQKTFPSSSERNSEYDHLDQKKNKVPDG